MKKLKILFISEYFPPNVTGGGELSCYILAKNLSKLGANVTVLTSNFNKLKNEETINNIKVLRYLKTGRNPGSILSNIKRMLFFNNSLKKELSKLVEKEKFDIIHFFNITTIPNARILKNHKIPLIAHINSPVIFDPIGTLLMDDFKGFYNFKDTIYRIVSSKYIGKIKNRFFLRFNPIFWIFVYQRYKRLINSLIYFNFLTPISQDYKYKLIKLGIQKDKIVVIPNIFENTKNKLNIPRLKDKIRIIYLGSYTRFKGVDILIDALKKLKIPYEANFYGEGNLEKYLIHEGKKQHIRIHPKVESKEVAKLIDNHHILIIPSVCSEAFGRVALEGMSRGKVVIASNIGGLKETIKNNYNGLLIKPGDSFELTKSIEKIYFDKDLYFKLSKNGFKELDKYSGEKIANSLIKFYNKIK